MTQHKTEKRILQAVIILACCVPLFGGLSGLLGYKIGDIDAASHYKYLSGLLFGIGICFLSCVPEIENRTARFQLLTFIVVTGGIFRATGYITDGVPGDEMIFALIMELVVTPLICLWQHRISMKYQALSSISH